MAPNAALAALLAFSAVSFAAALCVPGEPHVDCYFHSSSSPKWAPIAAQAEQLTAAWKDVVAATPAYPAGSFSGKGLVITATKLDMVNVPVLLEILQTEGFNLPVEIWYSGDISADIIDTLSSTYKKLTIKNVANYASPEDLQSRGDHIYQAKVIAIVNSKFEEVLFMDSDNVALSNPAALFESAEYKKTGALFWPDFWQTASQNPIWAILNLKSQGWEQESGQLVINKKATWTALNLAFFLAKDSTFQQLINGDKEAFRMAFLATGTPFHMIQTPLATAGSLIADGSFCGHTMVQHDLLGEALFLHHNSIKHGVAISWEVVKSASGSSFSIVPLPTASINGDPTSCVDMVGADVSTASAPFRAFETVFAQVQASTNPTLKSISQNEFFSVFSEFKRKLLQGNGTGPTSCGAGSNTCYAASGDYFICCSNPCVPAYTTDGQTPNCPGTLVTGTTLPPTVPRPSAGIRSGAGCPGGFTYCYDFGSGTNPLCCPSPATECGPSDSANLIATCVPTH